MSQEEPDFFRREVQRRRADSLHGTVLIAAPSGWLLTAMASILSIVALFAVLAIGTYPTVITATGTLRSAAGIVKIAAPRSGTLIDISVNEGDQVKAGQIVGRVASEDAGFNGATPDLIRKFIDDQGNTLREQIDAARQVYSAGLQSSIAKERGLRAEIKSAIDRESMQMRLVRLAKDDLDRAEQVAAEGFLSKQAMGQRQEKVVQLEQQLSALRAETSAKTAELDQTQADRLAAESKINADIAQLGGLEAELARSRASNDIQRGYLLRAPKAGRLENICCHSGESISAGQLLYTINPTGGQMIVEFWLNERLASSAAVGSEVRISLEAFPAQRYGYLKGRITRVSHAPSEGEDPSGNGSQYLAFAQVADPHGGAFRNVAFLDGMKLRVHVPVARPSLIATFVRFVAGDQ